jgi:hypothetical protein
MLVMDMRRMEASYTCCHIVGIVLACEVGLLKKKEEVVVTEIIRLNCNIPSHKAIRDSLFSI